VTIVLIDGEKKSENQNVLFIAQFPPYQVEWCLLDSTCLKQNKEKNRKMLCQKEEKKVDG